MWDLIVSVPDHGLSFYFSIIIFFFFSSGAPYRICDVTDSGKRFCLYAFVLFYAYYIWSINSILLR